MGILTSSPNRKPLTRCCHSKLTSTGYQLKSSHHPDEPVETVRYAEPHGDTKGRVWINAAQYFEGVPPAVWEFHVGGWPIA
ncbi:MAG: hypothetical protein NTZ24_10755 [Deltaproteobacteria bacterium]|nr:hypothetical protein [Deltaproteobacteria bacterium]